MNTKIKKSLANELWMEFYTKKGWGWLSVGSGSMMPLIRVGDEVQFSIVIPENVRFGDIVVFRCRQDLIIHRVIKKKKSPGRIFFLEKGDASYASRLLSANNIVGRVTRLKRGSREIDFTSTPSRIVNLFISIWFRSTSICINRLLSAKNPIIIRVGKFLHKPFQAITKVLIKASSSLCYFLGSLSK